MAVRLRAPLFLAAAWASAATGYPNNTPLNKGSTSMHPLLAAGRATRSFRYLCLFALFVMAALQAAPAEASGYPLVTETYAAPWYDHYTQNQSTGLYACVDDFSASALEDCDTAYWAAYTGYPQNIAWGIFATGQSCWPYGYQSTTCYEAGWGATGFERQTWAGQACIYQPAAGFNMYSGDAPTSGQLYLPGWCVLT